jgi:fructose-bisphosphate aldolase class I
MHSKEPLLDKVMKLLRSGLNAICNVSDIPWKLSFSFGRALQAPALRIWKGSAENVAAAQAALHHRAKCNGLAVEGKYSEQMESANG